MIKRFITLFFVIVCSLNLFSQQNGVFYLYGVDFTGCKVYAAKESEEDFIKAFYGINMLILSEPEKYNFSKVIDSEITPSIEMMFKTNSSYDFSHLKELKKEIPYIDYDKKVKEYDLDEKEGTGLVVFARFFNKPDNKALYNIVLFDIATREIIKQKEVEGKAGGFGLRNYWAGSLYYAIRKCKMSE